MRILDTTQLDGFPTSSKASALSLLGDAIDSDVEMPFGLVVGDTVFKVADEGGAITVSFAVQLALECGDADRASFPLPSDAKGWKAAYDESAGYHPLPDLPGRLPGDEVRNIHAFASEKRTIGALLGTAGIAIEWSDDGIHRLEYMLFADLRRNGMEIAAGLEPTADLVDLVDYGDDPFTEAEAARLLVNHEASLGYADTPDARSAADRTRYAVALRCLARAKVRAAFREDPVAISEIAGRLVMPANA